MVKHDDRLRHHLGDTNIYKLIIKSIYMYMYILIYKYFFGGLC